jgi:hypothetical protein
MTPKSVERFSDHVMRQTKRMNPKSAKRFLDQFLRQTKGMTSQGRFAEGVSPQTREA